MQPAFEIIPGDFDPSKTHLICEVSDGSFSFFFRDHESKFIHGLSLYQFNPGSVEEWRDSLAGLLDLDVLTGAYCKTLICYSYKDSVLLPGKLFIEGSEEQVIRLVHGDLYEGKVMTDVNREKDIYNVYSVPLVVHSLLADKFKGANFMHQYSVLLQNLPADGEVLHLIVYMNKIVARLVKQGQLQIIQSFNYTNADEALYHLVNTCQQFGVHEVQLNLAGLIEKESTLYRVIYNHFLLVSFANIDDLYVAEDIKELLPHYFSHLFSIGTCE